ncbi:MAG: HAD-IA family hydrolase [Halapricum sp.]
MSREIYSSGGKRHQSNVRFLPGAKEAIETATEHYRVGLVTNGVPWMQSQTPAGLGIADRFETIVHGSHDAAYKPNSEPLHTALGELGVERDRAVHVGNSLSADVAGPHNAGLQSVWLDGDSSIDPDPVPDYRVESMGDVADEPWNEGHFGGQPRRSRVNVTGCPGRSPDRGARGTRRRL